MTVSSEGIREEITAPETARPVDVVVIGAGQAGLSAAYHLARRALRRWSGFVVLDADDSPGGAWRHRPPTLTMAAVNGFHPLPDLPVPPTDAQRPTAEAIPEYFAAYEQRFALPVVRPARVHAVRNAPDGRLLVQSEAGAWLARGLINATGTWTRPFLPRYPGAESFRGRQLHSADYRGPEEFRGQRVAVVGGGHSAIQILGEVAGVAETLWLTRTPPRFRDDDFTPEIGRQVVALVEERVRAGLPPKAVVSVTGLPPSPALDLARDRGALDRLPMFDHITPDGVSWADGHQEHADAIVWATGFRPEIRHLAELGLRTPGGGIRMDGTQVATDPRIHVVGYGPSASTIGANRAGREAAVALSRLLS